ncbi:hypothetical protein FA95DRAFT_492566 [Auriscalpium vulgare]|uniref:Uncharacterized protein n=1 Tax=Auriscalpium vulgare TaxID=40419 RepID=A0ACB8S482_9AGAM|nr:hypothetical protein FA95DRAFT_492566 [Auriscalpium vulgare]
MQSDYIKQFLPWGLHTHPEWVDFLSRAWRWCSGRVGFTAFLMENVVGNDFLSPNDILDDTVFRLCGFTPTDSHHQSNLVRSSGVIEPILGHGLTNDVTIDKRFISRAVYDYMWHGLPTRWPESSAVAKHMLMFGVAHFVESSNSLSNRKESRIAFDEPIAVLATAWQLNRDPNFSFRCLLDDRAFYHSSHQNVFEVCLAYSLLHSFDGNAMLNDVFDLRSDITDSEEAFGRQAQLVVRSDDRLYPVSPTTGPADRFLIRCKRNDDVIRWLGSNTSRILFCAPPESMGPDLLFFMCIEGRLLLVALQAKHSTKDTLPRGSLMHAIASVTPAGFWMLRGKHIAASIGHSSDVPICQKGCGDFVQPTLNLLEHIPDAVYFEEAQYSLLRVIASYPAALELERSLDEEKDHDKDKHWIAEFRHAVIEKFYHRGLFQEDSDPERHAVSE